MIKQRGVGLVEVMVSITIGMLVLAGVLQLYATSVESQKSQEGSSRIQENMRYLTSMLQHDISSTGNFGCMRFDPESIDNMLGKDSEDASDGVSPGAFNFNVYVSGTEGTGPNNSDTVNFRFMSPESIPLTQEFDPAAQQSAFVDAQGIYAGTFGKINKWQIAVISNCASASVLMVTDKPTAAGEVKFRHDFENTEATSITFGQKNIVAAGNNTAINYLPKAQGADKSALPYGRLFIGGAGSHIYEIRKSARGNNSSDGSECDVDNPQSCGLFRDGEEIIDGVSDLQIEYGWVKGGQALFGDAAAVTAATAWDKVDRVRMDVTLSSLDTAPSNDGNASHRLQKTFSQQFVLRNRPVEG